MTVYNRERFVEAAVRSVLTQTFRDLELIVYDDASADGSRAVVRRLAGLDARIRVVEGATNLGLVGALRAAHEHAGGEFVGWIDSDDLLVNTALADTVAALDANPALGMVYTDHVVVDEHNRILGPGGRTRVPYSKDRLLTDFMTFHFRLARRAVFERAGGIDPTFTTSPDYDLCLRMSEVAEIGKVDKPLYCYRLHPGMVSRERAVEQIENSRRAVERALDRRGMGGSHELSVEVSARFVLTRKPGT